MTSTSNKLRIFCIGYNSHGEFGFGHAKTFRELTEINHPITRVYSSNMYSINSDEEHTNIWSAGDNRVGSCGNTLHGDESMIYGKISYFEHRNIDIKKICVSPVGYTTFFIIKDNKAYGCGNNCNDQLGLEEGEFALLEDWEGEDKFVPVLIDLLELLFL